MRKLSTPRLRQLRNGIEERHRLDLLMLPYRRQRFWAMIVLVATWVTVMRALKSGLPGIQRGKSEFGPGVVIELQNLFLWDLVGVLEGSLAVIMTVVIAALALTVEPLIRSYLAPTTRSWLGWTSYLLLLPWIPWLVNTFRLGDREYLIGYYLFCTACTVAFVAVDVHKRLLRKYMRDARRGFPITAQGSA